MTQTILGSLLFSMLVACGGSSTRAPAGPTQPTSTTAGTTCPVEVPGTSVTVEDTATGAALVFVTTGDVRDLRRRVGAVAATHNEHHGGMGPLPTGAETGGGGHDHSAHAGHGAAPTADAHAGHGAQPAARTMGTMISVHSKATAEDVEGGAKLVIVAFPDGVAKLQSELRQHAQHLASGTCDMDHAQMGHGDVDHSKMGH